MARAQSDSSATRWPATPTLTGADWVGIAVLILLLMMLSYLRSRHCLFWSDEIMGFITLKQPTFLGVLKLWRAGTDSSGIWYYVFGRPWTNLFGDSEVSLRLYTASGIAAGAGLIWAAARRFYSLLPVAASVTFVFASAGALRWQLANARSYGWLMVSCGWVIYLIARGEDEKNSKPRWTFLAITLSAYCALAGSHLLGVIYVSTFLATQIVIDLLQKRFRPPLYLVAACSYAVVLFSYSNIAATAALGKPHFWTLRPPLRDLLDFYPAFSAPVGRTVWVLFLIGFLAVRFRRPRLAVYVIVGVFACLDVALFLYSQVATSLYVDRYLLPFTLVSVLVLCELLTDIAEVKWSLGKVRRALPWALIAGAAAYFSVPSLQRNWFPFPDQTPELIAILPPNIPVLDVDAASFVGMEFYGHPEVKSLIYPMDREVAYDPGLKGDASGYNEMKNFKIEGIYAKDIQTTAEVLAGNSNFTLISSSTDQAWLERRILPDPRFTATLIGSSENKPFEDLLVWRVSRTSP